MGSPIYLVNRKKPATGTSVGGAEALDVAIKSGSVTISGPVSTNTAGSNTESTVSTVQTLNPPANAVGFILMNNDDSTQNIRWRIGATATSSAGSQLQPGRDTGYIPCAAAISICAESETQNFNIQWILSS